MNPETWSINNLQLAIANQQAMLEIQQKLALNRIDQHLEILDQILKLKRGSRR